MQGYYIHPQGSSYNGGGNSQGVDHQGPGGHGFFWITGLPFHDIGVRGLQGQADGGKLLCHHIDPQDLGGQKGEGKSQGNGEEDGGQLGKADREQIGGAFSDIVEYPPPLLDGADDGGEVVIGDDHIRGLFGDLGARPAHGYADIGSSQSRGVVHSVSGHGYDVASCFQGLHYADLVLSGDPGKY